VGFRKLNITMTKSEIVDFSDNLLFLGKDSAADKDVGFLGRTGATSYAGLVRDSATNEFLLINSITISNNTVNDVNALDASLSKGTLVADQFKGNLVGNISGNLIGNVAYDAVDPTGTRVLDVGDANTPATFKGDVLKADGTVIVDVSSTSTTFTGTVLGNVAGDVTTPDGSAVILDTGTGTADASLTVHEVNTDEIDTGTLDVTGIAVFTGASADFTQTQTMGNWNGSVYNRTGATLIVEDNATPNPIFHGDLDGDVDASSVVVGSTFVLPSYTTAQRDLISNPQEGQMIFNSDTKMFSGYNGTDWVQLVPSTYVETP